LTIAQPAEAQIDAAVDSMRPEAIEYLAALDKGIKTTQDNYGRVMAFLSKLDGIGGPLFLTALVAEGYPVVTAHQLVSLMGWSAGVSQAIERASNL